MPAPNSSRLSSMPVSQIRAILDHLLTQPRGSEHTFALSSEREALSLRARMNRIRATDRARNMAVYSVANRQARKRGELESIIPAEAEWSPYDDLIFRVSGPALTIQVGGATAAEFLALAGLTLPEPQFTPAGHIDPADYIGAPAPAKAPAEPATAHTNDRDNPNYAGAYDTAPRTDEDPFA